MIAEQVHKFLLDQYRNGKCFRPFAGNCHAARAVLIAVGALAGSALVGYYIGVRLTKRKMRVNNSIKLTTNKVHIIISVEGYFTVFKEFF